MVVGGGGFEFILSGPGFVGAEQLSFFKLTTIDDAFWLLLLLRLESEWGRRFLLTGDHVECYRRLEELGSS